MKEELLKRVFVSITVQKWSFPLTISLVNVSKFIVSCGIVHIYYRNILWKTSLIAAMVLNFLIFPTEIQVDKGLISGFDIKHQLIPDFGVNTGIMLSRRYLL